MLIIRCLYGTLATKKRNINISKLKQLIIVLFTVGYTPLAAKTLQSFQRGPKNKNGKYVFFYDSSILYESTSHTCVMIMSGIVLVLVLFGIPIIFSYKTKQIYKLGLLDDPETQLAYGPLYSAYKPKYSNFETYSLLRRGIAASGKYNKYNKIK